MPVDPKLLDALCGVLAEYAGTPVAVDPGRHYALLTTTEEYLMVGVNGEATIPPRERGPAPLDIGVLVDVCDAYLMLVDSVQHLPGADPFPDAVRATIVAEREKLRARL